MARSTYAEDYPWAHAGGGPDRVGQRADPAALGRRIHDRGLRRPARRTTPRRARSTAAWNAPPPARGCSRRCRRCSSTSTSATSCPSVHAPTLVLHRRHDRLVNVRNGRWLAEHLPNARLVEFEGDDHIFWYEDAERGSARCRSSSPGLAHAPEPERMLATVLFTDIVDSTRTAAELGDRRWREVLERHQRAVRDALGALQRPRGEVDRGRLSGHVRRPRPRDPLRPGDPRLVARRWGSAFAPASTPASAR